MKTEDRIVLLSTGPVFYRDSGPASGSGTPVVFLHAASGRSMVWEHQVPAFTQAGFRFIAIDYRGVGVPPGAGDWTAQIDELVSSLGLLSFHLLGTAAGGGNALQYVLAHGGRVRSLVIANSIGNVQDREYLDMGRRLRPSPQFDELPVEFRELGPSYRAVNPEGVARWLELSRISPALPAGTTAPRTPPLKPENAVTWARLQQLRLPTLLLTGDADLYAPPSVLRMFSARMPHAETAVIAETGHSSYWEKPEEFNRTVLEFLGRI
jgi:pimeloyl-ACP methyl ester carboxylesterase